jgi:hypothetical protein
MEADRKLWKHERIGINVKAKAFWNLLRFPG